MLGQSSLINLFMAARGMVRSSSDAGPAANGESSSMAKTINMEFVTLF